LLTLCEGRVSKHVGGDGIVKNPTLARAFHTTVVLLVERPLMETDTHLTRVNYRAAGSKKDQNQGYASSDISQNAIILFHFQNSVC
jgi:hypothetical protein